MTSNPPNPPEDPGPEGSVPAPSGGDQSWISDLVDKLVPKFIAQGGSSAADAAMQTDTAGKCCRLSQRPSAPKARRSNQAHKGSEVWDSMMDIPPFPNDPAPNNSPSCMDSDPSASTPPPTEQDLQHNFIPKPHQPPSFNEFVLQNASSPALASLNPQESETGVIPEEEDIKIQNPSNQSPSTPHTAPQLRKRSTRKRSTKPSTVKPVDLLTKGPNTNPTSEGPGQPPAVTDGQLSRLPAGHPSSSTSAHGGPLAANSSATEPVDNPWEPAGDRPSPLLDHAEGSAQKNAAPAPPHGPTQVESDCPDDPVAPSNAADSPQPPKSSGPSSGLADGPPLFHPPTPDLSAQSLATPNHESTTSNSNPSENQSASSSTPRQSGKLTILKSDAVRAQVVAIHHEFSGSKPSWTKYQKTWTSLSPLLQNRARAMHPTTPARPTFHLRRTPCSYEIWIQTITSLAGKFLSPSTGEQWYCPDLIDFPKLTGFGDKSNDLRPGSFIPTVTKTPHPESTIVRGLYRLLHPPQRLHADWARIIAASVELMADNLFRPPPPCSNQAEDEITHGVEALAYLDGLKNASSSFDPPQESQDPSPPPAQRFHSVDVLHEFRNVIIDVLMAYIIFQTHFLSKAPLTSAQKKAHLRAQRAETAVNITPETLTPVPAAPSDLAQKSEDAVHHLQKYQKKQNFQPLVYFVLAGVRGLFITSKDHRISGNSTCMSFLQAMSIIRQHSTAPHTAEEPIWKNLSAYLVQIFRPVFQSKEKICPLAEVKVPTRFDLAEAIAHDFLNQWQAWNPTSPFLLPHADAQITGI
ncbi:hypothetical protein PtB15_2B629 [Puccinia triticina]|nr:hypothetical protein PtB15_2B629 [Puccinia triticina]